MLDCIVSTLLLPTWYILGPSLLPSFPPSLYGHAGNPCKILEFLHVKPGKGSAFVRTKVKNLISGNTLEKTFRAVSE